MTRALPTRWTSAKRCAPRLCMARGQVCPPPCRQGAACVDVDLGRAAVVAGATALCAEPVPARQQGGKVKSRYDFSTEEEYNQYKQSQEANPKVGSSLRCRACWACMHGSLSRGAARQASCAQADRLWGRARRRRRTSSASSGTAAARAAPRWPRGRPRTPRSTASCPRSKTSCTRRGTRSARRWFPPRRAVWTTVRLAVHQILATNALLVYSAITAQLHPR